MTFHGGNIYQFAETLNCNPNEIIDFSSNIHFEQAINWQDLSLNLQPYTDPNYTDLKCTIKQRYNLNGKVDLELFNGASAAIFSLLRFLKPENLILYAPFYGEYVSVAKELTCKLHYLNRFKDDLFVSIPKNSTIVFVNPSTPDGKLYDVFELFEYWKSANCNVIIDESFLDFCYAPSMLDLIENYDKLFIVKSLCKFYGCAGIRVGFIASQKQKIQTINHLEPMWKISTFDNVYMQAALKNNIFIEQTRTKTQHLRATLEQVLIHSNLFEEIYDGSANFVLARLKNANTNLDLQKKLAHFRLLIRICDSFDFLTTRDIRFAVKSAEHIKQLAHALSCLN